MDLLDEEQSTSGQFLPDMTGKNRPRAVSHNGQSRPRADARQNQYRGLSSTVLTYRTA